MIALAQLGQTVALHANPRGQTPIGNNVMLTNHKNAAQ